MHIFDLFAGLAMPAISTFELLLKPQLPKKITDDNQGLKAVTRTILQGYFLTVANVDSLGVNLSLTLVTRTPALDARDVLATIDVIGQNNDLGIGTTLPATPTPVGQPAPLEGEMAKTKYDFYLNPHDTCLIVIQPDARKPEIISAQNFEARGYAEISLSSRSMQKTGRVLITAEHRGTFFDGDNKAALGEVAYALPLATGGSLIELQGS